MLNNFLSDKEETSSDKDQVLLRITENAMSRTCEKSKSFKKNDEDVGVNNQKQLNYLPAQQTTKQRNRGFVLLDGRRRITTEMLG